jgi:hypothetical protein
MGSSALVFALVSPQMALDADCVMLLMTSILGIRTE